MNERRQNIAVGITALLGIFGLLFMLLLFGYVPSWLREGYKVTVEMDEAGGLHQGGIVTYRGIEIGLVESVQLIDPPDTGVITIISINDDIKLPVNTQAMLHASMFGSSSTLALDADDWPQDQGPLSFLNNDGSAIITGESFSMTDMINSVAVQVESLSDEWTQVGRNLNLLLEPREIRDVDEGSILGNAATVVARFDARLAQIKTVIAGIESYVNDPQLLTDLKATAANAKQLTTDAPEYLQSLRDRYIALADNISVTVTSLKKTLDMTRSPDGTVGKLLSDPQLYNNINDAFERLQTAIDEMRLLVEKWKDEGLPVQF